MRTRPITALLAALALLAVAPGASFAQTPTPTPTATAAQDDGTAADPPADAPKAVKSVYDDYSRDGVIDVCKHTRADLQDTLDSIEPDFDRDFPDFREAVQAGIQRHDKGRCKQATATPTATATATPADTATPDATADDGALPPAQDDSGDNDGGGALPPPEDTSTPTPESGELPPVETPAPAPTPAPTLPPAATPGPSPTPAIVASSNADRLLVPGILIGIALLGGAALGASAFTGRGSPRVRHALNEAVFRSKTTWADFSDWLKIGR
ncbi:MAG TPA: hypothetical protein VNS09_15980 [Solirubrobacter sp.]|nr:hypothetical protein [Solirubrobacter sp.]